jgi:hypothetical protein
MDLHLDELVKTIMERHEYERGTMEMESLAGSIACGIVMDRYRSLIQRINEIYGTNYEVPRPPEK